MLPSLTANALLVFADLQRRAPSTSICPQAKVRWFRTVFSGRCGHPQLDAGSTYVDAELEIRLHIWNDQVSDLAPSAVHRVYTRYMPFWNDGILSPLPHQDKIDHELVDHQVICGVCRPKR